MTLLSEQNRSPHELPIISVSDGGMQMPFYTCDVLRAGPSGPDSEIYIFLRDRGGAFGPTWYSADDTLKKEMLATALTAISVELPLQAELESTAEYSTIDRLYVLRG